MPSTFKVTFTAPPRQAEAVASLLTETLDPPPAVSIAEGGDLRLVEAYFVERPDLDTVGALIGEETDAGDLQLHEIAEENWVALVQRGLHPVVAGRFLIHGVHDRHVAHGRRYAIEIEAGRAFGTAHHGTTRGCMIAIDRLAKSRRFGRVLDLGTGSGVLAIAAAEAGAGEVLATDIDAIAVEVAVENIRHNHVPAGKVRTAVAAGVHHPAIRTRAPFDLITANILAAPLIRLAPRIVRLAAPDGHIVLSGLLDSQAREVSAIYLGLGLAMEQRLSLEGWTTLVLRRGRAETPSR